MLPSLEWTGSVPGWCWRVLIGRNDGAQNGSSSSLAAPIKTRCHISHIPRVVLERCSRGKRGKERLCEGLINFGSTRNSLSTRFRPAEKGPAGWKALISAKQSVDRCSDPSGSSGYWFCFQLSAIAALCSPAGSKGSISPTPYRTWRSQ